MTNPPTTSLGKKKKYSFIQAKGLSEEDIQHDDLNSYSKPSEEVTLRDQILDELLKPDHRPITGIDSQRADNLLSLFQQKLEDLDTLKVTEPPNLHGMDARRAWMAGQMSILVQIKELLETLGGRK